MMKRIPLLWVLAATFVPGTVHAACFAGSVCCGQCTATGSSCESSADCAPGGACSFPDACLPGGAQTITSVVAPASSGFDNVYTSTQGWTSSIPGAGFTDIGGAMRIAPEPLVQPFNVARPISKSFSADAGSPYFLGTTVKLDPGAATTVDVRCGGAPARAVDVYGPQDWTYFGVPFTPDDAGCTLEIHSSNDGLGGTVTYKDFALYQLGSQGTWFRFTTPQAVSRVDLEAVRHNSAAPGYYPTRNDLFDGGVAPNTWSAWTTLDGWMNTGDFATVNFQFKDGRGRELDGGVTAHFQFSTTPSDAGLYFDFTHASPVGHLALILPEGGHSPQGLTATPQLLLDVLQQDKAVFLDAGIAPVPPIQAFWYGTGIAARLNYLEASSDFSSEADVVQALGFNALNDTSGLDSALWNSRGVTHRQFDAQGWQNAVMPGGGGPLDFDLTAIKAALGQYAMTFGIAAIEQQFGGPDSGLSWKVGDEIKGIRFAGPQYTAAFQAYVQTQAQAEGLDAGDFGVTAWNQLVPGVGADGMPDGGLAAQRVWYWQARFWNEANAQTYRALRDILDQNVPYPVLANFGIPWSAAYYTYQRGAELQSFVKAGAVTVVFGEDWLIPERGTASSRFSGDQLLGLQADLFRAAATSANTPFGVYLVHSRKYQYKPLVFLAHGGQYLYDYSFGPLSMIDGDAFAGRNPSPTSPVGTFTALSMFQDIARANSLISRADSVLAGATVPRAHVAIMARQTDPLWQNNNAVEVSDQGFHRLLTHGGYPVDFLYEDDLAAGALSSQYKVLFVNAQYIRNDTFKALEAWVEAGGTLYLDRGGATDDQYAQPASDRAAWMGVDYSDVSDAGAQTVTWGSTRFDPGTQWRPVSLRGAGQVLAQYADGGPAAVEVSIGSGKVRALGFSLGESYLLPVILWPDEFAFNYPGPIRDLLLQQMDQAGLAQTRPAWTSDPLVEARWLDQGGSAGAILLLNYNNSPVSQLKVTLPGDWTGAMFTSMSSGSVLPLSTFDGGTAFSLDLSDVDVVVRQGPAVVADGGAPDGGDAGPPDAGTNPGKSGCGCGSGRSDSLLVAALLVAGLLWGRRRQSRIQGMSQM